MKAKFFDSLFNERRDELAEITNELDSIICRLAEYQRHDSPFARLAMVAAKRVASYLADEDSMVEWKIDRDMIQNSGDLMLEQEREEWL